MTDRDRFDDRYDRDQYPDDRPTLAELEAEEDYRIELCRDFESTFEERDD